MTLSNELFQKEFYLISMNFHQKCTSKHYELLKIILLPYINFFVIFKDF